LFQPSPFGARLGVPVIVGAVASRLIVTDSVAVPPALVAVQVNVTSVVSAVTVFVASQAGEFDVMADCGSLTENVTVASLVYHPLLPSVPLTFDVINGGVVSMGAATVTW
jgi:hypothetical protein